MRVPLEVQDQLVECAARQWSTATRGDRDTFFERVMTIVRYLSEVDDLDKELSEDWPTIARHAGAREWLLDALFPEGITDDELAERGIRRVGRAANPASQERAPLSLSFGVAADEA